MCVFNGMCVCVCVCVESAGMRIPKDTLLDGPVSTIEQHGAAREAASRGQRDL